MGVLMVSLFSGPARVVVECVPVHDHRRTAPHARACLLWRSHRVRGEPFIASECGNSKKKCRAAARRVAQYCPLAMTRWAMLAPFPAN